MGDYDRTTTVHASVDDLFDYLARVENLPKYMHRLTAAHSVGGDRVEVAAEVPQAPPADADGQVHGEAWFRVDAEARTIEWGGEDDSGYHGSLQVSAAGEAAQVELHLHTVHDGAEIERGIDETLENIEQLAGEGAFQG